MTYPVPKLLNQWVNRRRYRRQQVSHAFTDRNRLGRAVEEVGAAWKQSDYYDSAEQYMEDLWTKTIWPFISECDFSCVVDLAAGHGRNTRKLREIAKKIYVVDIHEENLRFCRKRFVADDKITFIQNDGFTLGGIGNQEVTLIYCFDSMVHFDSDVVRSYLTEFYRVLKPGGHGFCHHSNYDQNPRGRHVDNPGWRNFMSKELFLHYCAKEGFEIVKSQVIDWGGTLHLDCLTLFQKPISRGR